jgi:hypothetical protein
MRAGLGREAVWLCVSEDGTQVLISASLFLPGLAYAPVFCSSPSGPCLVTVAQRKGHRLWGQIDRLPQFHHQTK